MAEEMQKITGKLQEILQDEGSRRESYRERIKRFPNVMEESFEKTKEVWLSLYKKVENSLNDDILFGLEDEIRQKNVLVYILWQMNDKFSAEKLANEVREKKPDNLVALTNLAFIHLYDGNISEVRNLLDNISNLEERENFSLIEAEGKRNVAYCLATISFEDHERAVELYKESLNVCPDDYLCMFSISLLQYRCLRKTMDKEKLRENIKESIQYLEKIRCAFPHHIDTALMGRTLALIEADGKNDEEEKDQLRRTGMDKFVLALKSAVEFLPSNKDLIEIWEIKEIILDLYEYGNGNTEYKKFVLEFIHSIEDLANDKAFQNILHKSEL
ncbi:interferon-induced protein with tetratricopeptide repeats 1B-like [Octopus vulgaris]|uniref:Interferon-induced protein with tetratricopeptide repeats 1B-like n=1 Tax=Octopus vulgaris TaxID=6645 RepID=A0AA36BPD6_OCTVU|nr:interferon-induced protein with tetratricopeptide repeats 1B-like [Octopus vulgaris]